MHHGFVHFSKVPWHLQKHRDHNLSSSEMTSAITLSTLAIRYLVFFPTEIYSYSKYSGRMIRQYSKRNGTWDYIPHPNCNCNTKLLLFPHLKMACFMCELWSIPPMLYSLSFAVDVVTISTTAITITFIIFIPQYCGKWSGMQKREKEFHCAKRNA